MLYALMFNHPEQEQLINELCFDRCGKIIIGWLMDDELGSLAPCREDSCPYEEKRMEFGTINNNGKKETVWLRKLQDR